MIVNRKPGETLEQYLERVRKSPNLPGSPSPPPGWDELFKELEEQEKKEEKQPDGDS